MNKLLAKLTAALMLFSLCSCSTAEETDNPIGSNAVYDVLGMGKIPVGMWVTPPDGYRTEDAFRLISESGINVVNGFGYSEDTDEEVKTVLDCCQKYGLKYLYSSLSIEESIKSYKENPEAELISSAMEQIDKFAGHPAYAGQLFIDEPSVSYFDTLKEYITEYKKRHSDKLCYVNMLPYYALAGTGSSRYEDYVDTWIDKTSPAFYSYDSYPLIDYDPTQEGYRAEMEDFYYNLDLLRAKTLENGIPLWTFVATLGYQHASEPNRREPTREELRWQVFSNLAFGAKGLQYFCYWTPSQDSYGGSDGDARRKAYREVRLRQGSKRRVCVLWRLAVKQRRRRGDDQRLQARRIRYLFHAADEIRKDRKRGGQPLCDRVFQR